MDETTLLSRIDYTIILFVVSPLHLGSGEERNDLLPPIDPDADPEKRPLVAAIVRDHAGKPYIPGSSLKGALRAAASAEADALFGSIKDAGGGQMGALLVRGATQILAGQTDGLPHAQDHGVFVVARTKIHEGVGVSDPNKLFHAEQVAPRTCFEARLRLETRRGDIDALERALFDILERWMSNEGGQLGGDGTAGFGRVRVRPKIERTRWHVTSNGGLEPGKKETLDRTPAPARDPHVALRLVCDGPFLTRNPEEQAPVRRDDDEDAPPRKIRALRSGRAPFVMGSSVIGALRARFAWQEACRGGGAAPPPTVSAARSVDGDRLGPTDRLFGCVGWRGVLTVAVQSTTCRGKVDTTSVRIDRFSGGTIDNALFTIDADIGVELKLDLYLDERATDDDRAALDRLVKDLRAQGLELGHGTGRGFGWFKVEAV